MTVPTYEVLLNGNHRCRDGKFRHLPWYGTYPSCTQIFTHRGAVRVVNGIRRRSYPDDVVEMRPVRLHNDIAGMSVEVGEGSTSTTKKNKGEQP